MFILNGVARAEICIKKSRFLSEIFQVESVEDAKAIIKAQKEKYFDARHVVHAFSIGLAAETLGASDAGEPAGTAGEPTLNVLRRFPLTNCLITTTRWFGGILLGTGGLSRAYSDAAALAVATANEKNLICEYVEKMCISLECDYADLQKVKKILANFEFDSLEENFSEKIRIKGRIKKADFSEVQSKITNATCGKAAFL